MKILASQINKYCAPLNRWAMFTVFLLLSACGNISSVEHKDNAPLHQVDPKLLVDAIPREDAITRAGNKNPYTVLGKTYYLLPTSDGYSERGVASWYGTKFHGRPTANGEPYNLYSMTAAHRTLPIPAYVKVTNLKNNRTVIVRVNDRGPFHNDRIIDLSYAAAVKLGYAEHGTTEVLVETIKPQKIVPVVEGTPETERYVLQIAAFKSLESANTLRANLLRDTAYDVFIKSSEPAGFYRVQLGPLSSIDQVQQVTEQLNKMNIHEPKLIIE